MVDIDKLIKQAKDYQNIDNVIHESLKYFGNITVLISSLSKFKHDNSDYEIVKFDVPNQNEEFITSTGYVYKYTNLVGNENLPKRFIVKKKEPRKFVFEEVLKPDSYHNKYYCKRLEWLVEDFKKCPDCVPVRLVKEKK